MDLDVHRVVLDGALAAVFKVVVDAGVCLSLLVHGPVLSGPDGDHAFLGNRLYGVLDEVQECLLDPLLVGGDAELARDIQGDGHFRRYLAFHKADGFFKKVLERQGPVS